MTSTPWPAGPVRPRLAPGTVDVWCADLASATTGADDTHALLAPDERERAARFADPAHGRRWAAGRGILRALLAAYVDADPAALRFAEGAHGKPALANEGADDEAGRGAASTGARRLRFNLSHSGDVALYAITLDREVGVDVELPRRAVDHVAIARRILGAQEAERLATLDPPARERAFLRAWVRWEAVLKCRGTGIAGADAPAADDDPWVRELEIGAPAAAALAVAGGRATVRCWRWPVTGA
ncbi:MAG TPA: 4'-phosphopantetheinyl transferase superfamily protein [Conexibacter sp.]|nr:4'-phosphopantetheinyl transferase superfamily protein [Conexibacter sp.]